MKPQAAITIQDGLKEATHASNKVGGSLSKKDLMPHLKKKEGMISVFLSHLYQGWNQSCNNVVGADLFYNNLKWKAQPHDDVQCLRKIRMSYIFGLLFLKLLHILW